MADFVAVLKKTLDGLGDTTPAMRERSTRRRGPPSPPSSPPSTRRRRAAVADRQKRALEDAIAAVEQDYAKPRRLSDPLRSWRHVFADRRQEPAAEAGKRAAACQPDRAAAPATADAAP